MTKVQIQFKLERPLDAAAMSRLADTSSLYGILSLKLAPELDALTIEIEYDATRLKEKDVEAALARAGVAVIKSSQGSAISVQPSRT
jgi:hypothetical protein